MEEEQYIEEMAIKYNISKDEVREIILEAEQGIYNAEYDRQFGGSAKNRAIVPKQLCEEILTTITDLIPKQVNNQIEVTA